MPLLAQSLLLQSTMGCLRVLVAFLLFFGALTSEARARVEVIPETHPLISLIEGNDDASVRAWIQKGYSARTKVRDARGETLLERAMVKGSERVFSLFLADLKDREPHARLSDSRGTPLVLSLTNLSAPGKPMTPFYEREIIALLDAWPELLKENDRAYIGDGRQAIHGAAAVGNLKLLNEFIDRGVDLNVPNAAGETPLHLAARAGHLSVVRALVAKGARLNEVTRFTKASPLMYASETGHDAIIRYLLISGAKRGDQDVFGKTAHQRYKEYVLAFRGSNARKR